MNTVNAHSFSLHKIEQSQLPKPYNFLLTQPLMTPTLEQYYARTAIVQTQEATFDARTNSYSRTIVMMIDSNKERNNAECAQKNNEAVIIELAFIKINFNELSKEIINEIRHTNIPFGTLLHSHHVKIRTKNRCYFTTPCTKKIASYTHCELKKTLYGRMNTIIRADNKKWLAQVMEIITPA